MSSGNHNLGSRIIVLHPVLKDGSPNSFVFLFGCQGPSLEDLVQRGLPWDRKDTFALWEPDALYERRNGAEVTDKPPLSSTGTSWR